MWIFADADVGRRNIVFGIALILLFGIGIGIPLTIDFFGGSILGEQYQVWKVVHGYGIFLGFINYFFGLGIDRLNLSRRMKELSSWAFLGAGLFGGVSRMILILFSAFGAYGIYASLGESAFITLGMIAFLIGQKRSKVRTEARYSPRNRRRSAATVRSVS